MGYSVEMMCLFAELADRGYFKDVKKAVDLGSQEMHFSIRDTTSAPYKESIRLAIKKISGKVITADQLDKLSNRASTGSFFSIIGVEYKSLDTDGWYGSPFDFNFDQIEPGDRGKYCLTVNAGTTEHLINQLTAFSIAHDLTRCGGLMIHTVPFLGYIDHGFFNYNPNFFSSLARFNSYEVLGLWLSPTNTATLLPWGKGDMLKHLRVSQDDEHNVGLFCAFRKTSDASFCVPFQAAYEPQMTQDSFERYSYTVDGARLSGALCFQLSRRNTPIDMASGRLLLKELVRRVKRRLRSGLEG
jgi:hypothetical protein